MDKSCILVLLLFGLTLIEANMMSDRNVDASDEEIFTRQSVKENWNAVKHAVQKGRTFGLIRRIKMLMPALMFKLGVIATMLIFLTIFSMKGLAIGIMLLILQFGNFFAKIYSWKPEWKENHGHAPHDIHVHVHGDKGHAHYDHHDHGYSELWDRNEYSNSKLENYLLNSKLQELRKIRSEIYSKYNLHKSDVLDPNLFRQDLYRPELYRPNIFRDL